MSDQPHDRGDHDHDHADEGRSWWARLLHGGGHFLGHDHDHTPATTILDTGAAGIKATKISLIGLGATAAIQASIVVLSGSVALMSDTLHNLADALTAIPLWIAFAIGRRPATKRYTYGFHRAEDLAGLIVVVAIALSATLVVSESLRRLFEPRLISHIPWVIAAGVVGAMGNEIVARYRISAGRRIGSEALVTDGRHARTDALTSLAVVVAGVGAAFGLAWVDPVAGLAVAVPIVWLFARSARRIVRRLSDGIEPEVVERVESIIADVDGVRSYDDLRVRWHGHQLRIAATIGVDPSLTVGRGHDIAHDVEHALHHGFSTPIAVTVHIEPEADPDRHAQVAHHRPQ